MNSVLQCLLSTKPFTYDIHDYNHSKPCEFHDVGFCIICALDSLFMSLVNYTSQALYIHKFVHHTTIFSPSFTLFKQDAHKFFLGVLNLLEIKFKDSKILCGHKPYQASHQKSSSCVIFVAPLLASTVNMFPQDMSLSMAYL
ncbi:UCH domain-containing protein [Cephalotus follicularis]|uniref:UCH domain-containing protein n=1 Tax=Cephalotus follicularis TaxID=3775 RepID=A0A1Q3CPI9_CEPFO|nr:UCH domain-containing protein [Cephalotus follicularis]